MNRVIEKFKVIEKHKALKEREICLFGLPLAQYGEKNSLGFNEKYFSVFPKSFEHKALDMIIEFLPKDNKHDHVWIVRTVGLGEAHLLNYMLKELKKKWNAKNPCFMSQRAIYKEMYGLYSNTPFYPIQLCHDDYAFFLKKRNVKYRGIYFHIHHCTIYESRKWLNERQQGDGSHAIKSYKEFAGIKEFDEISPKFSEDIKQLTLDKVKNLNFDKFVFIVPEANGAEKIDEKLWAKFINRLKEAGFDIFINSKSGNSSLGKSANLNIGEAAYLSSLAKGIVAIRCGFTEVLAAIKVRGTLYTLYTPFRNLSNFTFFETYTLQNYPFFNNHNTYEYIIDNENTNKIFNTIFDDLTKYI